MSTQKKPVPIAVTGLGCIFPAAPGVKEFWRVIAHGEDTIGDVPETHWNASDFFSNDRKKQDHVYCTRGGYLPPVAFNPAEFGIPPNIMEATDTSQLLSLIVAKMALEDAGYTKSREFDRDKASVILGVTGTQELVITMGSRLSHPKWKKAIEDSGIPEAKKQEILERISGSFTPWQENSFPGLLGNVVAGRIANRFNFGGTNTVIDSACASSLSALNLAFMELQTGRSDVVLSGGVDALNDIFMHMCFSQTGVLSLKGEISPFSESADGTLLGEGIGMVVLKRLEDAEKENDKIYAVLKSVGASSDGRALSIYAPSAKGQAKAIRMALNDADIDPSTIELVEAHGTGTKGDIVEFTGLSDVYKPYSDKKNWCALGTVKSNIGHTKAAAGAAGLIKGILSLHHKVLPPTLNAETPAKELKIKESPFYLATSARPWVSSKEHPRRCGVTSCGFGGSNFHAILEEYKQEKKADSWDGSVEILAFSANSKEELAGRIEVFSSSVPSKLTDPVFGYEAQETRKRFNPEHPFRTLILMTKNEIPSDKTEAALNSLKTGNQPPAGIYIGTPDTPKGDLGFIYPGQGSQYTGMGKDLINTFSSASESLETASSLFDTEERSIADILFPLPDHILEKSESEKILRKTDHAQPAIGTISLAMTRLLDEYGIRPDAVCGHSFGELSAMYAAGWIDEKTLLQLSIERGRLMASCGENAGTMLAVRAPLNDIEDLIKTSNTDVVLANKNTPDQGVLSGSEEAIDDAEKRCKENGFSATRIPVAAAFHSRLVKAAAKPFHTFLDAIEIRPTQIPVLSNTTGDLYPANDIKAIKEILGNQLLNPVEFVKNIETMYASGIRTFVEAGPKTVLSGLVKSILGDKPCTIISLDASSGRKSGLSDFASALCRLAAAGFPVDLTAWEDQKEKPATPKMTVMLTGANLKPEPKNKPKTALEVPQEMIEAKVSERVRELEKQYREKAVTETPQPVAGSQKTESAGSDIQNRDRRSMKKRGTEPAVITEALSVVQEGLRSMQAIQAQTAEAHNRFLEAQTEAGKTLQAMMEKTQQMAETAFGGTYAPSSRPVSVPAPVNETFVPEPVFEATLSQPVQTERMTATQPRPVADRTPAANPTPVQKEIPVETPQPGIAPDTIQTTLLEVVSDLTGYPVEMLGLEMDLEADLGIDSIKRVEILSSFEEKVSDLPPADPEKMSTLKTLGEISGYLAELTGSTLRPKVATTPSADMDQIQETLLEVVSELTGYPVEMIDPGMDIEADLGIDSIKRVEILSTFEERVPNLPPANPDRMSTLKTLGEISDYLAELSSGSPAVSSTAAATAPAIGQKEIQDTLLDVVSQLTGYPVEMLDPGMDIEADLGIDSIKRVEILSTFEERVPDLPPANPDRMSTLKTLGEISEYLAELSSASAPAPVVNAENKSAMGQDEIQEVLLDVVSQLTGYPVEMLDPGMDIEADLGIDSIKRVEILSTFEERVPDLPPANPDRMSTLKTLGEIASYLAELSGPVTTIAPMTGPVEEKPSVGFETIAETMLDVVSRLTGYPVEMLDMEMDIEADLGIDSIKRVEIMSEFEAAMPDLPTANPDVMATLKTLKEICNHLTAEPAVQVQAEPVQESVVSAEINSVRPDRQVVTMEKAELKKTSPVHLPAGKKVYVTDDLTGISEAIVSRLNDKNIDAQILNPSEAPENAAGLVIIPDLKRKRNGLWNKKDEAFLINAFEIAKSAAETLIRSAGYGGAFFATITRLDGRFGFREGKIKTPLTGGLAGIAKTASIEWPEVNCKAIDIDPNWKDTDAIAEAVVSELLFRDSLEIGLSENERVVAGLVSKEPESVSKSPELGENDIVVISGGAKGVTAEAAVALAETVKTNFALLGRSAEPSPEPDYISVLSDEKAMKKAIMEYEFAGQKATPVDIDRVYRKYKGAREINQTLKRIESTGSSAAYYSCDVRDAESISSALDAARNRFGTVAALIHGAGVLEDRFIADKTTEQFQKVYSTKVDGLSALLKAAGNLRYLVLFSSVSARLGNKGQVDYSVANEVLNKAGRYISIQNPDCRVTSINWGPWDGGMVNSALKKEFARQNIELIPLKEGAQSMVREMAATGNEPVEIVIGATSEPLPEKKETEPVSIPIEDKDLQLAFKKDVDTKSYPILNDHRIDNTPVVPFALMTEWLGHGALHSNPGFTLHGIDDMRLYKGIKIKDAAKTIRLLSGKPIKNNGWFEVPVELRNGHHDDATPVIHTKGTALLTNSVPTAPEYSIPVELLAKKYEKEIDTAYDTVLFHGNELKGIQSVEGYSAKGMVAKLTSAPPPAKWISDPLRSNWVADPLILDSAYQMAILWCHEEKGMPSLPSYSKSYRQYTREFPEDGITAVMEVKEVSDHKMTSDFTFLDNANNVVATIDGYEAVMDSSLAKAFEGKPVSASEIKPLFDRDQLLAYAIGNPSEAFGEPYKVFDNDRIIARLPGPPYFFMDSVTAIDHTQWELKPGGWVEATYTIPQNEWYFNANKSDSMPFCVLLEIALQPCGWLAAYAGSALRSENQLKFRNLGGDAILHRELTRNDKTLTMRTRMSKVSEAAGMIIEDFDIQVLSGDELIYDGTTNFGFFSNAAMENQVGIRNPETFIYQPSSEELAGAVSVELSKDAPLTPDDPTTSDHPMAALPSKALLMVDRIDTWIPEGGPEKLGFIKGIKDVDPDEWFFKAHFYQDPVCPGSLGLESFIQLIKFAALEKWGDLKETHSFEFLQGCQHKWIYRGQVVPQNKEVEVTAIIKEVQEGDEPVIKADGYLCVDGKPIYQMSSFSLRMTRLK